MLAGCISSNQTSTITSWTSVSSLPLCHSAGILTIAYPRMEHCTDEHTLPLRDYSHTMTSIFFRFQWGWLLSLDVQPTLPHSLLLTPLVWRDGCHIIALGGYSEVRCDRWQPHSSCEWGSFLFVFFSDLSPAVTELCWLSLLRFMWRLVEQRCCLCSTSLVKFLISCQSI